MNKLSEMLRDNGVQLESGIDEAAEDSTERYYKTMAEYYNRKEGHLHLQDGYHCAISVSYTHLTLPTICSV